MTSVLHVGSGFRPWLTNGLIVYTEELMASQVDLGYQVAYFFPGRHYPVMRRPRLHRWRRGGVTMLEWMATPILVGALRGTPDPEHDLADSQAEEVFVRVLTTERPDIVHIHDLGGLPSSLIPLAREHGLPVVLTVHDYALLCPTVRLFDVEGQRCMRLEPGAECARCCSQAPTSNAAIRDRTLGFEGQRARRLVPGLAGLLARPTAERTLARLGARMAAPQPGPPRTAPPPELAAAAPPEAYQRRRDTNLARLNSFDRIMVYSQAAGRIITELGVRPELVVLTHVAASHLERLHPGRVAGTGEKLTFGMLGVMTSRQKGADIVLEALRLLHERGLTSRFRLLMAGHVPPDAERELHRVAEVEIVGSYTTAELDSLLDRVDVGVIPSVWEEVYGIVGDEFLAKGIPVLGNALGGIVDYVEGGRTGWLNHAIDAAGLADCIASIIAAPEEVVRLSRSIAERRAELITPMSVLAEEVRQVYADAFEAFREPLAASSA